MVGQRDSRGEKGAAVVIVLGLVFVLGAFGLIVVQFSRSAYREVDTLSSHLRAVAVAELAYAELVGRLVVTPWENRWFKTGPDAQMDQVAAGGSYEYLIRDAPQGTLAVDTFSQSLVGVPNQADLFVRATHGRSSVSMFWRLLLAKESLDSLPGIVPIAFTFGPERARARPGDVDSLSEMVSNLLGERERRRPRSDSLRSPLAQATTAVEIQGIFGMTPPASVLDSVSQRSAGDLPNSVPLSLASRPRGSGLTPLPSPPSESPLTPATGTITDPVVTQPVSSDSSLDCPRTAATKGDYRICAWRLKTLLDTFQCMVKTGEVNAPASVEEEAGVYMDALKLTFGSVSTSDQGLATSEQLTAITNANKYMNTVVLSYTTVAQIDASTCH